MPKCKWTTQEFIKKNKTQKNINKGVPRRFLFGSGFPRLRPSPPTKKDMMVSPEAQPPCPFCLLRTATILNAGKQQNKMPKVYLHQVCSTYSLSSRQYLSRHLKMRPQPLSCFFRLLQNGLHNLCRQSEKVLLPRHFPYPFPCPS